MIDTNGDRISAGVEAESLLARLRPQLVRLRDKAIHTLVAHCRAETLTDGNMRQGIAMLAVVDELERELSNRVRLGQKDFEESKRVF